MTFFMRQIAVDGSVVVANKIIIRYSVLVSETKWLALNFGGVAKTRRIVRS